MINERELRIGNYFEPKTREWSSSYDMVEALSITQTGCDFAGYLKDEHLGYVFGTYASFKPIPLTEEWLIKFGFESINNDLNEEWSIESKEGDLFLWNNDNSFGVADSVKAYERGEYFASCVGLCKHVHTLQNLYFALTQTELKIKQ